uniref:FAS1 domain-containing protein n=1 Tax=Quercus lobata TaxID=97700 RepID=A0A7N2M6E1_QUELO
MNSITRITTSMRGFVVLGITLLFEERTATEKTELASLVHRRWTPKTHRLKKPAAPVLADAPPVLPIYDALAPGPSLAPAPALAPGPGGPHGHFNDMKQVKDFIHTLLHYGGYNEMANILVNLTSLATEMGWLVSEGYVLTVLAPNDEAMAKLTTDQLSEPGAPEQIIYYHITPEYQTEESIYNAMRGSGRSSMILCGYHIRLWLKRLMGL